jgi:hypothetical protein
MADAGDERRMALASGPGNRLVPFGFAEHSSGLGEVSNRRGIRSKAMKTPPAPGQRGKARALDLSASLI